MISVSSSAAFSRAFAAPDTVRPASLVFKARFAVINLTPLESYSCTNHERNSHGITLLHKN